MIKQKKAFTLIEIMVVIALIWLITLWITKLNFNTLSDKQKVNWFFHKIKTNTETIKNNALIWKAIKLTDWTIIVPKKWKIDFNNDDSWKVIFNYFDWSDYKVYKKIVSSKYQEIIIKNNNDKLTQTWSLIIEWWNLTLSWITSTDKILNIEVKYKNLNKFFTINSISGVIEEK